MTYSEMLQDVELYLAFYSFGLASGLFLSWIEGKAQQK